MTYFVYGLYEPSNGELRYIGKTTDPASRLASHLSPQATKSMRVWVRSLGENRPVLRVLSEYTNEAEALIAEHEQIRKYRKSGARLLNSLKFGTPSPERRRHFNGFGSRVAQLRRSLGMSGLELERISGICPMTLSKIEKEERGVRADTAVLLARALGTTVEWLVTGEGRANAERAA